MPISNHALDAYVSQHLSEFTTCRACPLGDELPDCSSWFRQFVRLRIFNGHIPD
jgi:hypothetical protein